MNWTGIEEVTLSPLHPFRMAKGKYRADKLWKLTRFRFNEDGKIFTEYSMQGYTTESAALNALGGQQDD